MCEVMTTSEVIVIISGVSGFGVIAAATAAWVAALYSRSFNVFSKRREKFSVYLEFMMEYRSSRMHAAVRDLNEFLEEYESSNKKKSMKDMYEGKRKGAEYHERKNIKETERLAYLETTLHYRRRLVSQFYQSLHETIKEEIVEKDNVFGNWTPGHLDKMIRKILVPIGRDDDKGLNDLLTMAEVWAEKRDKKKIKKNRPRKNC